MHILLKKLTGPGLFLCVALLMNGCSESPQQKNFKAEAFSRPSGITQMTVDGKLTSGGSTDSDDWRISPVYSGLIEVQTPAHPNPVPYNSNFKIDLYIESVQPIDGIAVYTLNQTNNSLVGPFYEKSQPLDPGLLTITLNPRLFANSTSGRLYRLLIYDNGPTPQLITYGDIQIE